MTRALTALLVLVALGVGASFCLVILDEREQAFRALLGEPEFALFGFQINQPVLTQPGVYLRIPGLHQLERYDRRLLRYDAEARDAYTSEKLLIMVDYFAMWRIEDPRLFYESNQTMDGALRRLDTITYSIVRESIGRQPLTALLSPKRDEITASLVREADQALSQFGIRVRDLRIRRTDYVADNLPGIYERMRTERSAVARKYRAQGEERARTIRAEADFESQVVRAGAQRESISTRGEGDALAAKIYADAYGADPEFYAFWRSLEAYREALDEQTTLVLSPENPFLQYLFQDAPVPTR